ncbi:hypothetical protein OAJ16_02320 [Deltaproteobacteria bacterium]|nr:hypothetical protein [Deltaproteobacteria bacterium]
MNTFHNITAQTFDILKKQLVCGYDFSKEIYYFTLPVEHSVASWRMHASSLSKWNSSCFELLLSGNRGGMRAAPWCFTGISFFIFACYITKIMRVLYSDSAALQRCVFEKISQSGTFAKIEKENHEQCIDYDTGWR